MSSIKISSKAYCKMILHAAKYPHCSINGLLLSKASSVRNREIEFVDAIPLFHVSLNLTPMAEIALMQIDEVVSKKGLVIAGYYTAMENNSKELSLDKVYNKIAEKIAVNCSTACLFLVDNTKLNINMDNIALKVAQYIDGNYKLSDINRVFLEPDNTLDICSFLLERQAYNSLVDFDNHLDNVSLSWLNNDLNKIIENAL